MRYWVSTANPVEAGTLLREENSRTVPEVLRRDTLEWTPTSSLLGATEATADWDEITQDEAERIEAVQRAQALQHT